MDDGIYLPFHADFSFTPYGGVFKKNSIPERERERKNIKKRKKKDRGNV